MTFARGVFIFAFVMLIAGAVGARLIIGPLLFGDVSSPSYAISARQSAVTATPAPATSTPRPRPTARIEPTATALATATPRPTATRAGTPSATPTSVASAVARPAVHARSAGRRNTQVARPKHTLKRPKATAAPSATPHPVPSPTPSGIVTLTNYWVGSATSHPGSTIAVGYVIDNETGKTEHIELGASVKSTHQPSWATDSISDPGHDVVAIVPPGVSRHVRYFTLSPGLPAGAYDIAWGLRNPSTGSRVALVAAPSALRVQRVVPAP